MTDGLAVLEAAANTLNEAENFKKDTEEWAEKLRRLAAGARVRLPDVSSWDNKPDNVTDAQLNLAKQVINQGQPAPVKPTSGSTRGAKHGVPQG